MDDTPAEGTAIPVRNEVTDTHTSPEETGYEISDDIRQKVDELSTPLNVYNYLKNNINTEFYYGERKGAMGTYDAMAGNDYDQAGLLIAMLRYLGYEAEYVRGIARFTEEQAVGLTGATDIENAADVMASCGTPVTLVSIGEDTKYVDAEHVWVRANLPYTNYRGALPAEGEKVWLDLDTSVKAYEDVDSIYELMDSKGVTDEMSAFVDYNIDTGMLFGSDVDSYLDTVSEKLKAEDLTDVYAVNRIIKENVSTYLPASLQYEVTEENETFSVVKNTDRDRISFSLGGADLGIYYADETADKSIILSFVPASASDAEIYNSYASVFEIPAYAVSVNPVIYIDGVEASSAPVTLNLGESLDLNISIDSSGKHTSVNNKVKAGSMYAVTLDTQMITPSILEKSFEEAKSLKDTINTDNAYTVDELGKLLSFAGKLYFAQVDAMDAIAANSLNVSAMRSLSEGITGYEVNTKSIYGVTSSLSEGSLFIDVDTDVHSAVYLGPVSESVSEDLTDHYNNSSDDTVSKQYMLTAGFFSSYFESAIWEELTGENSISTISVFEQAIENNVPFLTVTKKNIDSALDNLRKNDTGKLNDIVVNDIRNAVAEDKMVIIPEKATMIGSWAGYGYILMDSHTGAGAYMISGGTNGGMTPELIGIAGLVDIALAVVNLVETVALVDSLLTALFVGLALNPVALVIGGIVGILVSAALISFALYVLATTFELVEASLSGEPGAEEDIIADVALNIVFIIGTKAAGKILRKLADKAIMRFAINKCGQEVVERIVMDYGDDAIVYLRTYGEDFVKICDECGEEGYNYVRKYGKKFVELYIEYGYDVFKYTDLYGDDFVKYLSIYGKGYFIAVEKHGSKIIYGLNDNKRLNDVIIELEKIEFGTGDVVYGASSNGALREFAEKYGGKLLQDLGNPFDNGYDNWLDYSKATIESIAENGGKIHFDLTNIDNIEGILKGTAYVDSITTGELLYIRDNWERLADTVKFYSYEIEVSAPWIK